MVKTTTPDNRYWIQQPDAAISLNPTSGVLYEVISPDPLSNVRIEAIMARVVWTVQPSPLEVWILCDGIQHKWTLNNPATATNYYGGRQVAETTLFQPLETAERYMAYLKDTKLLEGIEAEITGGTVSSLICRIKWSRYL